MRPWYAKGARAVIDARRGGWSFPHPVDVSLVGGGFVNVAESDPVERLYWRMLVDLPVELKADESVPLPRLLAVIDGIARARPRYFLLNFVRNNEEHKVEIGDGFHMPRIRDIAAEHKFTWCPINVSGTQVGRKLRLSLLKHREAMTVL